MKKIMDNLSFIWGLLTDPLIQLYAITGLIIAGLFLEGVHRLLN